MPKYTFYSFTNQFLKSKLYCTRCFLKIFQLNIFECFKWQLQKKSVYNTYIIPIVVHKFRLVPWSSFGNTRVIVPGVLTIPVPHVLNTRVIVPGVLPISVPHVLNTRVIVPGVLPVPVPHVLNTRVVAPGVLPLPVPHVLSTRVIVPGVLPLSEPHVLNYRVIAYHRSCIETCKQIMFKFLWVGLDAAIFTEIQIL